MEKKISVRGAATIGFVNASWPFANFKATKERIDLNVIAVGRYSFSPEQIVKIEKTGLILMYVSGIKIYHCVPNYPERMIFGSIFGPQRLLNRLFYDIGFIPKGGGDNL
ncbi:MAG: hypothetical protein AAF702_37000 [Chloroflexota bacterium]